MGRSVDCPWVWADKGGPVDVFAGEDAGTVVASELGPAKRVVVARSLESVAADDIEGVTGGVPRSKPLVYVLKVALLPD